MTTDAVATASGESQQLLSPVKLREEVYVRLRKRILSHEYAPGFRFDLLALEKELGISRTPLKEALHRLEVEGLVDIRPRRGTFVISIDAQSVAEDFDVRRALELYAAEAAVREATDQDLQQLNALAEEMRRLLENNDYQSVVDKYIHLDHQFHNLLVGLARNKRLIEIYEQIDVHVRIARVKQKFTRSDSKHTESEHDAILEALERLDGRALVKALSDHIELSKARMLKVLEEHV
jgi:DNA-binding GntR family transcriptional regulator